MNLKLFKKPIAIFALILVTLAFIMSTLDYRAMAYNHGDWLIKRKVLEVFKLYSKQQDELKEILGRYMSWHRRVMLKNYIAYLADADDRLRALELDKKKFSPEEMDQWLIRGRDLYVATMSQLGSSLSPLLVQLNESQVDRARTLLDRRLGEWRELKEVPVERLMEDLKYSWQGNFDFVLGSINQDQEEVIASTIKRLYLPPNFQLAYEGKLNQELLSALESIATDGEATALKKFDDFIQYWHRESELPRWRIEASKLITKVLNLASSQQIAHFKKKIHQWRELMVDLNSAK